MEVEKKRKRESPKGKEEEKTRRSRYKCRSYTLESWDSILRKKNYREGKRKNELFCPVLRPGERDRIYKNKTFVNIYKQAYLKIPKNQNSNTFCRLFSNWYGKTHGCISPADLDDPTRIVASNYAKYFHPDNANKTACEIFCLWNGICMEKNREEAENVFKKSFDKMLNRDNFRTEALFTLIRRMFRVSKGRRYMSDFFKPCALKYLEVLAKKRNHARSYFLLGLNMLEFKDGIRKKKEKEPLLYTEKYLFSAMDFLRTSAHLGFREASLYIAECYDPRYEETGTFLPMKNAHISVFFYSKISDECADAMLGKARMYLIFYAKSETKEEKKRFANLAFDAFYTLLDENWQNVYWKDFGFEMYRLISTGLIEHEESDIIHGYRYLELSAFLGHKHAISALDLIPQGNPEHVIGKAFFSQDRRRERIPEKEREEHIGECPICLEDFGNSIRTRISALCGHTFCHVCWYKILKSTPKYQCSLCRMEVKSLVQIYI